MEEKYCVESRLGHSPSLKSQIFLFVCKSSFPIFCEGPDIKWLWVCAKTSVYYLRVKLWYLGCKNSKLGCEECVHPCVSWSFSSLLIMVSFEQVAGVRVWGTDNVTMFFLTLIYEVPQGLIHSRLLFNIYMKSLGAAIHWSESNDHQYADYIQL